MRVPNLVQYTKIPAISVELADGTRTSIRLRKRIGIDVGPARVLVRGVYYIPVMKLNILSGSILDESGVTTTVAQERVYYSTEEITKPFPTYPGRNLPDYS